MDEAFLINELKNFLDKDGKLKLYPAKFKLKITALFYLAAKFEHEKQYTEKEVNQILLNWHTFDDYCLLRRELYNKKFLGRERNCSAYWKEEKQPTLADFGLE